ncbi:MAG: septum formation initiator family protein [Alphaproteobacteria bacterium]|nr:septum formation initiator family protein [Alphaproteobacteria bacterium]
MVIAEALKRYAGQVVRPVLGTLVVAYIAYHAVQGDRGLLAYFTYSQELSRATATLDEVRQTRERLANRVALLRTDGIDPDLLEERARMTLDLVAPDEFIVILPSDPDNLSK